MRDETIETIMLASFDRVEAHVRTNEKQRQTITTFGELPVKLAEARSLLQYIEQNIERAPKEAIRSSIRNLLREA